MKYAVVGHSCFIWVHSSVPVQDLKGSYFFMLCLLCFFYFFFVVATYVIMAAV